MALKSTESVTKNSDIFILTELALHKPSETFAPFGNPKAVTELSRGTIGSNVASNQSAGLMIESIDRNIALTDELQKDLTKASSHIEELKILNLNAENSPENLKMLEAQATQFTQQLNSQLTDLTSKQKEFGNILQQTAQAAATLSDEIKKILEEKGSTNVDSKVVDQTVYELFLSQSGKIKRPEKKMIDALVESMAPEKEKKAAIKEIRAKSDDFVKTLADLQTQQDTTITSLESSKNATEATQKDLRSLQAQKGSVEAFNTTAQKIVKNAHDQIEAATPPETPGQAAG